MQLGIRRAQPKIENKDESYRHVAKTLEISRLKYYKHLYSITYTYSNFELISVIFQAPLLPKPILLYSSMKSKLSKTKKLI